MLIMPVPLAVFAITTVPCVPNPEPLIMTCVPAVPDEGESELSEVVLDGFVAPETVNVRESLAPSVLVSANAAAGTRNDPTTSPATAERDRANRDIRT
jgi:hypothetical protein